MRALFITVNPPEAHKGVVNAMLISARVSDPYPPSGASRHLPPQGREVHATPLAQLGRDAVDACLGTGLVIAAGRAGDADAADRVLANLDRKSAADADDSRKRRALPCARIL